jgi:single-stranded-DNA-specific exonuclease
LSGVGVVYKFFEYVETQITHSPPTLIQSYLDLVALGEVSDVMNMTTLENRWIVDYGLSHINNKFFKTLVEK